MSPGHIHRHDHDHAKASGSDLPAVLDLSVPDSELSGGEVSRRGFLRSAGLLGAGAAASVLATPGTPAAAGAASGGNTAGGTTAGGNTAGGALRWMTGDHHVHTQYSNDGKYRVIDHVRHAAAYGLDWLVITDHGNANHARIGVDKVNPDIVAARSELPDLLLFQGLEWNIPAAEHGTVIVHPGQHEVAVLAEFEASFDGIVHSATDPTPANEALAIAGLNFLADAVRRRRTQDALFLANHPARKGIDSPHEIRAWRDAQPTIAVGMEGAPGHQGAGTPAPYGPARGRGLYDNTPGAASFPGYPLESYRTFGGFDWMTATVGGLWDSMLAEGKPWWITANSDSHQVIGDPARRGPNSNYDANGQFDDPVYGNTPDFSEGDFWPGFYTRTHVGSAGDDYRAVMDGIRAGRIWVDHGGLISGLDARLRQAGDRRPQTGTPLGGVLRVKRGATVELTIDIALANRPNWAQFVPTLARVDVIAGAVTGAVANADTFTTPATKVVTSFEVGRSSGRVSFSYAFPAVDQPFYVRLRGTDGKRAAVGLLGAGVDPAGPAMDIPGSADPWTDLWFYANPIWVIPL